MRFFRPYFATRQYASSSHQNLLNSWPHQLLRTSIYSQVFNTRDYNLRSFSTVTIPDLFVSFLAQKPVQNPNYAQVKALLEASMRDFGYNNTEYAKRVCADFPYFAALFAPTAAVSEYQTICDYLHWIFDFDDLFDDGNLSNKFQDAQRKVDGLLAILSLEGNGDTSKDDILGHAFRSIWKRIVESSTKGVQERFSTYIRNYCDALLRQVGTRQPLDQTSISEYTTIRSESLGALPFFPLIEYYQFLDLPNEVMNHHSIKEIETIAVEIMMLHNDLLSYQKECTTNPTNPNIISLYRHHHSLSQQQAYDAVDSLLRERYKRWYIAHSELPVLGEKLDEQVQRYVHGCGDVVRSNLNWR
ncbi:hypothetical protein AJ79_02069 [Helicocarpus griseus UAMH5409]|uniref:Terpene synthase n=1 Tax=Helicocarpus griseus UAMH5409 TaxID=1447875 RepID=A0A2B7Y4Y1_9EURO|nr:hypothetical protein AJ79_02069 [Helicocarpus griseus UAMH5409]